MGALGAHVDVAATGGKGTKYQKALAYLKHRFPYRKWRVDEGEFYGTHCCQDPKTKVISMSQKSVAEALKPVHLPQRRKANRHAQLDSKEISILRGVNGSLNWLASVSYTEPSRHSCPDQLESTIIS